jgi:hypothetical protein
MLPALRMVTTDDKLTGIQRVMRRFISPILVDSVMNKALADGGFADAAHLGPGDLEELVANTMVGLRLFVDPADLPELMVELTALLTESAEDARRAELNRSFSATFRKDARGR